MENAEIRYLMQKSNVSRQALAEKLKMSDLHFTYIIHSYQKPAERLKILKCIEELNSDPDVAKLIQNEIAKTNYRNQHFNTRFEFIYW